MTTPNLIITNVARRAFKGLGDGTRYASATGATPDTENRRFTLTGYTDIDDLGANVDDLHNGSILRFRATGMTYEVTDWVAGSLQATVTPPPDSRDTGACDILRAFHAPFLSGPAPASRLVDARRTLLHKSSAVNVAMDLMVCLPNLIGQGGFEEVAVGTIQNAPAPDGQWGNDTAGGPWSVSATSPILGTRMGVWTIGGSDAALHQYNTFSLTPIVAGRAYRLILKCRAVGGATDAGVLDVQIMNGIPTGTKLDADWGGAGTWALGAIGTSASWFTSPDLVADFSTKRILLAIAGRVANKGAATAIHIDEVYLWDPVAASALALCNHNWDGATGIYCRGYRCHPSRSNAGTPEYVTLVAANTVAGSGPYMKTWTNAASPDDVFPIYRLIAPANAAFQYEAGELVIGRQWPWDRTVERGWEPQRRQYKKKRSETDGGAKMMQLYFERRRFDAQVRGVTAADEAIWEGVFRDDHIKNEEPFVVTFPPKITEPILMSCDKAELTYEDKVRPRVEFEFGEVL